MPRHTTLAASILSVGLLGAALIAGPLDPPPGPIASTFKTLSEVEPRTPIGDAATPGDADSLYRITQPGSYYLTGNITGVAAKHGIEIATSNVSIDLNGFELRGVPGSLDGIGTSVPSLTGLCIRNGTIRSWGGSGIDFMSVSASNNRVSGVTSTGNSSHGFEAGGSSTLTECVAASNAASGFSVADSCSVVSCIARLNSGHGMLVGFGATVDNCTAANNGATGIYAFAACTIRGCSTQFNQGDGIQVGIGALVTHTSNSGNSLNGIRASYGALILENNCRQNGDQSGSGAGILVTNSDCRVEGNSCTNADRGIEVQGAGNLVIRNSCASNTTDWVIAANNVCGPIIDRRAPASAAVNGFAAPSSLGSTDANANVSH